MLLQSPPLLPRPLPDPQYLMRLRANALARMRQDELAIDRSGRIVTRRWSLQRLSMLLTGFSLLLRSKKAIASGSLRVVAPQYGAPTPGMPGNPSAYNPPKPVSLADLGSPEKWYSTSAPLLIPGFKGDTWSAGTKPVPARQTFYRLASGDTLPLVAIADADTGSTYILRGRQAFYIADENGIRGCVFQARELVISDSLFRVTSSTKDDADAIRAFGANIDEKILAKETAPSKSVHIDLSDGVPAAFWPSDPKNARNPWLTSVHLAGNLLIADLMVYQGSGTFTIDLKKKKLVKFVDDADPGKWYGKNPYSH